MCGIFGIFTSNTAVDIASQLISRLELLEYRGYDSSGIAIIPNNSDEILVYKELGEISQLQKFITNIPKSNFGIGHVRWAAIGQANDINNAHPHKSGNTALVHNGNIENYRELAEKYNLNPIPNSDSLTLTKILDSQLSQNINTDPLIVISNILQEIRGSFALLIISKYFPKSMVVAKRGSPISFAHNSDTLFISSDPSTLKGNKITDLCDGDIALLTPSSSHIINNFSLVNRKQYCISDDPYCNSENNNAKNGHMLQEILYQPTALQDTITYLSSNKDITKIIELLTSKQIIFVSCGSSYFASVITKYWFEKHLNTSVKVEISSEFASNNSYINQNHFVIFISQSGQTADTMSAIESVRNRTTTLSITNTPNSPINKMTHLSLITQAKVELGVASTKTFTSQLITILFLLNHIKPELGIPLHEIPYQVDQLIPIISQSAENISSLLSKEKNILIIGRGLSYAVALEAALKLKELSYIHTEAIPAGELKHGSIALIDENILSIALAPNNNHLTKIATNAENIYARKGRIISFTDKSSQSYFTNTASYSFILPETNDFSFPFIYTLPFQLISYYTSRSLGNNPDKPRNLAKSVTVE